jgi:hypothetical protein
MLTAVVSCKKVYPGTGNVFLNMIKYVVLEKNLLRSLPKKGLL